MSYFDDQEDAWFEHDCQGDISDVNPYDPDWKPTPTVIAPKVRTEAQKARSRRSRTRRRVARARHAKASPEVSQ